MSLENNEFLSSVPNVARFNPKDIKFQYRVIRDVRKTFNYNYGTQQILLSGAVGSAKSILMAHLIITHCMLFSNANVGIGRRSKPSLKTTLIDKIIKHLAGFEHLFNHNISTGNFYFNNGSKIIAYSWGDSDWMKVRSEEFSMFAIEELTENDSSEIYDEILMRIGRLTHIDEKVLISATNPDEPDHWVYKKVIEKSKINPNIHVYYSKTTDNKFLPMSYIKSLQDNLDPRLARRMLNGEWISIQGNNIYYNYNPDINYVRGSYEIDFKYPINISHDFNIGTNKPMSLVIFQYNKKDSIFHVFDEIVIQSADTEEIMQELAESGRLNHKAKYIVNGDATGKARNSASKKSDYDVVEIFLDNYRTPDNRKIDYEINVPRSNPPIRTRHNTINMLFKSVSGNIRTYVYEKCETLHEGLRLCKLLKGSKYQEDDSKHYQHVTTAFGYGVIATLRNEDIGESKTLDL